LIGQALMSGACFDAALGLVPELTIMGTDFSTRQGGY
jgi:hypothetical protein